MIRLLLADTSPELRLPIGECHAFATSIGTPVGDSLSPVLFTVYLDAALRDLRSRLLMRPLTDANLPLDVEYADDTDFISIFRLFLNEDVARRKQLTNVAFRKLSTVWFRRSRISLPLRLRLYESFVVPVLIYNMAT